MKAKNETKNAEVTKAIETPPETIARVLLDVEAGIKRLDSGPLKRQTVVLLLAHASGVSQTNVRLVMDAMGALKQTYLK